MFCGRTSAGELPGFMTSICGSRGVFQQLQLPTSQASFLRVELKWRRKHQLSQKSKAIRSFPSCLQVMPVLNSIHSQTNSSPDQKIQKRPLLHAPITDPRRGASSPKIVYISASSSFIATVKRVQKLLSYVEDRAAGPLSIAGGDKKLLRDIEAGIKGKGKDGDTKSKAREEEVVMKATGKAIEKLLRLAIWWQGQDGVVVRIRTGSVGAVDDVVERGEGGEGEGIVEESRVRRTSCLEVGVRLR